MSLPLNSGTFPLSPDPTPYPTPTPHLAGGLALISVPALHSETRGRAGVRPPPQARVAAVRPSPAQGAPRVPARCLPHPRGVVWCHARLWVCVHGCGVPGGGLVGHGGYAIRRVQPLCTLISLTLVIVVSLQIFSVLNSDDASAPALETQPQGDEEGECPQGAGWGAVGLGVDHGPVLRLTWDRLGLPFSSFICEASCPC